MRISTKRGVDLSREGNGERERERERGWERMMIKDIYYVKRVYNSS